MEQQFVCWHGKVVFEDYRIILRNYISQYQHEIVFVEEQNDKSNRILDCRTTWYHVYVLFLNGTIYRLPWCRNLVSNLIVHLNYPISYEWSYNVSKISISTVSSFGDEEKFSHFGLHFLKNRQEIKRNIHTPIYLLTCTEKSAYFIDNSSYQWQLFCLDDKLLTPIKLTAGISPNAKIDRICAGKAHCILLDSFGCVYSFGVGTKGELGHGTSDCQNEPKLVEALGGLRVKQIAAGGWHSAALTACDDLYVWGWNNNGQLGIDKEQVSVVFEPTFVEIKNLEEVNFKSVSCGSTFTLALTESGDVYFSGQYKMGRSAELVNESTCFVKLNQQCNKVRNVTALDWSAQMYYD